MASDPVCGMYVDETTASLRLVRENRTYYFCSSGCRDEFAEPEERMRAVRWQLAVAWPASVAVIVLTYSMPFAAWPYAAWVLASVVQFYPGLRFYRGAWDALRTRTGNMDVLIAVGTTAAYAYSAAAVVAVGQLPSIYFFDASAFIVTLILTGNYLEHLTRQRASSAVVRLRELLPRTARRIEATGEQEVPLNEVRPGDRLRILPGERFPADGTIRSGHTSVNEALLTGEAMPVPRGPGDPVIAGAINGEGALEVVATAVGADTFLAEVGRLVTEAETSRVPLQRTADRIASVFVPVVLVLAVGAALGWYLAGGAPATIALLVFVTVSISACPCAFGIATPAAILVGTGRSADEGVLFKGEDALERTASVDQVYLDKTGTVTSGKPSVADIVTAPGTTRAFVLAIASGVEGGSEHPLARAVIARARELAVDPMPTEAVRVEPGAGVHAETSQGPAAVLAGDAAARAGVALTEFGEAVAAFERNGWTWSVVVLAGRAVGLISFSDPIAPHAVDAVRRLTAAGIPTVMITGDRGAAAQATARAVGIREVHSQVLPAGKLERLRAAQLQGHRVAFVGDGINDAAAITAADAGMAIGSGTDVAKEAGRVILVRSDLRGVPFALSTARRVVRKVRQNLLWAIGYNAILLPIAAGALVPLWGFSVYSLLPILGAAAMGISSTTVVLNSLSLRRIPSPSAPVTAPPGVVPVGNV